VPKERSRYHELPGYRVDLEPSPERVRVRFAGGVVSESGERASLIEFEKAEHLRAWREHARHRAAQVLGRERFYEACSLHVCEPVRESHFDRAQDAGA